MADSNSETLKVPAADLSPSAAYEQGHVTAVVILVIALILGLAKCVQIMRRATTQRLGVMSLALILIAWLLSALVQGGTGAFPGDRVLLVTGSTLSCLFILGGFICGIVALATYDRGRYSQGRAQATWSVVLGGVFIVAVVVAVALSAGQHGSLRPDTTATTGPIENQPFNFSIALPAHWGKVKTNALVKDAAVTFVRTSPSMYGVVIAENEGVDQSSFEDKVEIIKAHMTAAADVTDQKTRDVTLNGNKFLRVVSRATPKGSNLKLAYETWILEHKGFLWQIVMWSDESNVADLAGDAEHVAGTFRILDPNRASTDVGVHDVDRPELGYRTHLESLGWNEWKNPSSGHELVDFRVERRWEAMTVIPMRMETGLPDVDALERGFLSTMDFAYPDKNEPPLHEVSAPNEQQAFEIERERKSENLGMFKYVFRLIRSDRQALFVAGWYQREKGDEALLRKSIDAVDFVPVVGDAKPSEPARVIAASKAMNQFGLSYFARKKPNDALTWFAAAMTADPTRPIYVSNVLRAYEDLQQYAEGLTLLAGKPENITSDMEVTLLKARLQVQAGNADDAVRTFQSALARGLDDEDKLDDWIGFLLRLKQHAQASQSVDAWIARHPTVNARHWQASIASVSGDPAKAVVLLEKLSAEHPTDAGLRYSLGQMANHAGQHEKAEAIAKSLLAKNSDDERALRMLGYSQLGRKHFREAKQTFETAQRLDPDDEAIADALRDASAGAGQGDNSALRAPIVAVAVPQELAAILDHAETAKGSQSQPLVALSRSTGYFFEPGKPARHTIRRRMLVRTQDAAKEIALLQIPFDTLGERVYVNRVEVRDGSGKIVAKANVDDAYVTDAADGMASHRKVMNLPIPGIVPGTVVESEISVEDLAPSKHFAFTRYVFAHPSSTAAEAVFVTGRVDAVRSVMAQSLSLKEMKSAAFSAWVARDLDGHQSESFAPPTDETSPTVWLDGDEGEWRTVAADYLKDIADLLEPNAEIKATADRVTTGISGEHEKIDALARFVQRQISYQAIEFGVRARRPYPAAETLRRRLGDCKDHSLLLYQLLRAEHITAYMALVNTQWSTQAALPSLDQFNHVVVIVPALGNGWLIDTTDKDLPLAELPADGLWGKRLLLLDPAQPRLLDPNIEHGAPSIVESHRRLSVDGADWLVDETLSLRGYYGAWMRGAFAGLNKEQSDAKLQRLFESHGTPIELRDFAIEGIDDPSKPMNLKLSYRVRDLIHEEAGRTSATLPAVWEREYLSMEYAKNRKAGFELDHPLQFLSEVTFRLPGAAASSSKLDAEAKGTFAEWKMAAAHGQPEETVLHYRFESRPGRFSAADYKKCYEEWDAAGRAWQEQVSWTRPESLTKSP